MSKELWLIVALVVLVITTVLLTLWVVNLRNDLATANARVLTDTLDVKIDWKHSLNNPANYDSTLFTVEAKKDKNPVSTGTSPAASRPDLPDSGRVLVDTMLHHGNLDVRFRAVGYPDKYRYMFGYNVSPGLTNVRNKLSIIAGLGIVSNRFNIGAGIRYGRWSGLVTTDYKGKVGGLIMFSF